MIEYCLGKSSNGKLNKIMTKLVINIKLKTIY